MPWIDMSLSAHDQHRHGVQEPVRQALFVVLRTSRGCTGQCMTCEWLSQDPRHTFVRRLLLFRFASSGRGAGASVGRLCGRRVPLGSLCGGTAQHSCCDVGGFVEALSLPKLLATRPEQLASAIPGAQNRPKFGQHRPSRAVVEAQVGPSWLIFGQRPRLANFRQSVAGIWATSANFGQLRPIWRFWPSLALWSLRARARVQLGGICSAEPLARQLLGASFGNLPTTLELAGIDKVNLAGRMPSN